VHPHEIIADFVCKYGRLIYPRIQQGDSKTPQPVIDDVHYRFELVWNSNAMMAACKAGGVVERYRNAVKSLYVLTNKERVDITDDVEVARIDRAVNELDMLLSSDAIYQAAKKGLLQE